MKKFYIYQCSKTLCSAVNHLFTFEICRGCWLIRLVGMHDPRMHRCATSTIAILILDFMKFEVSEKDFPDFLAWLRARFCIPSLDARIDAFAGYYRSTGRTYRAFNIST